MALISTQQLSADGLTPSFQAASSGGDSWLPTTTTFLMVENTGGSSQTVTVITTAQAYGRPVDNIAITVPGNTTVLCGPYDPGLVASSSTGVGNATYSSATGLQVAAISST